MGSKTRRAIEINGFEEVLQTLELSKATTVQGKKRMIHFDELEDGTWRLIFSKDLIDDFTKIKDFTIIREE